MRIWKWVGLAGVVGVTALGVAAGATTVRRRRRRAFIDANPDELRTRLHERLAEARARNGDTGAGNGEDEDVARQAG